MTTVKIRRCDKMNLSLAEAGNYFDSHDIHGNRIRSKSMKSIPMFNATGLAEEPDSASLDSAGKKRERRLK